MPRGSRPGERRGGRKPGTPNKATRDIQTRAREFVEDPDAVEAMRLLYRQGVLAPRLVVMFHEYAYGKPKEQIELTGKDGGPVRVAFEVIGG